MMRRVRVLAKKLNDVFFGTRASGVYILTFAFAIGLATFIENDFGTSAAQKLIYKAKWFELLLILFSGALVSNIIRFRMFQQKKWALLLFHSSMIIIFIGAGITRYFSYEGVMHIREGSSSDFIYSGDTYLNFEALVNGQRFEFDEPVLFSSLGSNDFDQEYLLGNRLARVRVLDVIPNPVQEMVETADGVPILKIVFGGNAGRSEYFLSYGNQQMINGVNFNFDQVQLPNSFNIFNSGGKLFFITDRNLKETVMSTQSSSSFAPNTENPLQFKALYDDGVGQFVFGQFIEDGRVVLKSEKQKLERASLIGIKLGVEIGDNQFERMIYGTQGQKGRREIIDAGEISLAISYGAKEIKLPFSLSLRDFIMDRYPGTNSPASFASEVTLKDSRSGINQDYRIFMNNILDYDGYRFFQSSYDRDELGTYLSVNHDYWGTLITYLGYALLTIGLIMVFFSKKTRFYKLSERIKSLRNTAVIFFLLMASGNAFSQKIISSTPATVSKEHSELFSTLIVQDFRGRMKPMHTLSRELLRKVSGSESLEGKTADKVVLSMFLQNKDWYGVPMVRLGKHEKIPQLLGVAQGMKGSYRDFFNIDGSYKLGDEIINANNMNPADRSVYEKQLISVDERVNILNMIFSGRFFKVVPIENDPSNTWVSLKTSPGSGLNTNVANKFFESYSFALNKALQSGNYSEANQLLLGLKEYQKKAGSAVIPSQTKVDAEILLNKLKVFKLLAFFNTFLGLIYLFLLFFSVFNPKISLKKILAGLSVLTFLGFLFHTFGLGLRWYVSGRAPWSNGYESMIYIAWTSSLAGLLFSRKSPGGMAATLILSGTVLLIALLSYLDPEITPLVPVLRSYWLTIHVSLEAGSYGFLMLGAIIGLINLLLFVSLNSKNALRVKHLVTEMTYISEMILIGGIVMLSIGTYLGGVWANESWGRYWGWDAKETWALVSILVYAFILHMQLIPGLRGLFAFNFATLFGLSSVIMTYFGVNYYLSGLHSYAAGDPIPIPMWVYIAVVFLLFISSAAYWKYKSFLKKE